MKMRTGLGILILCGACFWTADTVSAQDGAASGAGAGASQGSQQPKKKNKKLAKELGSAYDTWIQDEVNLIITPEERRAFEELSTNEEREAYIEIIWNKRNPNPESPVNPVKEEHYRRLAYADEHFASGIRGRQTDRGRIYILWGAPDEIESHPTGGSYQRPMEQGGGSTTTYAWEMWRYRHLEGIGENIELEFVDPSGTGEYRLTMDPCEKDAAAHVPGMGTSLSESLGGASRSQRFSNTNGTTCPQAIGGLPAQMNEFDVLDRYFRVQRAPEHFRDLAEKVSSRMVANQLPFQYRADFLRATGATDLVPLTVELKNRDLSFQVKNGVHTATLDVYGRITDPGGRVVQTFEDVITHDIPNSLFASSQDQSSVYQKSLPLRAGLYRLDIVLRDTTSGTVGILGAALRVPRFEDEKLDASSLILADRIQGLSTSDPSAGPFVLDRYKVRPSMSREFGASSRVGVYLQVYNLTLDPTTHKTRVAVAYRVLKGEAAVWQAIEPEDHLKQGGEQLTLAREVPVGSLAPGKYTLEVTAIDLLTNQTVVRTTDFTIKAAKAVGQGPGL